MTKLYNTTKKLLDKIAEKRSDVEIYSTILFNSQEYLVFCVDTEYENVSDVYITLITADTLLDLLPKLFGGVDNPDKEYQKAKAKFNNAVKENKTVPDFHDHMFGFLIKTGKRDEIGAYFQRMAYAELSKHNATLDKALIQKYFTEGLWQKDQVAVLEDVIKNIDLYL